MSRHKYVYMAVRDFASQRVRRAGLKLLLQHSVLDVVAPQARLRVDADRW
jgi:hypothetical protein